MPVVNIVKHNLLARATLTGYKTFDGYVGGLFNFVAPRGGG